MWWGIQISLAIASYILEAILDALPEESEMTLLFALVGGVLILGIATATNIKRWHDRDKSGWMVLILLIPLLGWLWSLIELGFLRGTEGENRFGPDPLEPLTSTEELG